MLMPEEYNILLTNHNSREYMLHDDFYDEEGNALQPIDEGKYEQFLEHKSENFLNECVENNLSFKEINNFINLINVAAHTRDFSHAVSGVFFLSFYVKNNTFKIYKKENFSNRTVGDGGNLSF